MPKTVANYDEALAFIFGRINYERLTTDAYPPGAFKLDRVQKLLELLGSPHERIPVVHIAGTKGKGSTAAMTAEILTAAGYRTGLFTSPHITAFEERFQVNGRSPDAAQLVALLNRLLPSIAAMDAISDRMHPTYFEIAMALAWLYFEAAGVEIAVLEVGLGGRLDATNLCRPVVTAITSISYDHMAVLGDTLPKIAAEKAGIIKAGVPVISGVSDTEAREVIENICLERVAPLFELGSEIRFQQTRPFPHHSEWDSQSRPAHGFIRVETPTRAWDNVPVALPGEHQSANAAIAVGLVSSLKDQGWNISEAAVQAGMARVKCPLRIEVVSRRPTVILDAAHNTASVQALIKTLREGFRSRRKLLIFAASRDKDVTGLLSLLLPEFDDVFVTEYQKNPRAVPIDELIRMSRSLGDYAVKSSADPPTAFRDAAALASEEDLIVATGSFFVSAELRDWLANREPALSDAS